MWAKSQVQADEFPHLLRDARDYALLHGLILRDPNNANDNHVRQIPFTILPSPFPKRLYEQCISTQPIVNKLMQKIAQDPDFMRQTLDSVLKVDDFTRGLFDVHDKVAKAGLAQPIISCINRSDYMLNLHAGQLGVRQVEVNAIASSMAAHSVSTSSLHRYILSKYRIQYPIPRAVFPENDSIQLIADGIIEAFDAYGTPDAFVLVVIEERSLNFSDHVQIELQVHRKRPDVRLIRRRFKDLPRLAELGPNNQLIVEKKEIALVYFRYCYDPSNYNFPEAWPTRYLLEKSQAIKCPSINFHIAGAKKFQQVLNDQQSLEKFLDPNEAAVLSKVFCRILSLADEKSYQIATISNDNLVLKPQREGGGHNIFGKDVASFVKTLDNMDSRAQYILMDLIRSPSERNWLLYQQDDDSTIVRLSDDKLTSELGIYGSVLADHSGMRSSRSGGYLVRSKRSDVNEGGVASGYAGISSLVLIDDNPSPDDYKRIFHL